MRKRLFNWQPVLGRTLLEGLTENYPIIAYVYFVTDLSHGIRSSGLKNQVCVVCFSENQLVGRETQSSSNRCESQQDQTICTCTLKSPTPIPDTSVSPVRHQYLHRRHQYRLLIPVPVPVHIRHQYRYWTLRKVRYDINTCTAGTSTDFSYRCRYR